MIFFWRSIKKFSVWKHERKESKTRQSKQYKILGLNLVSWVPKGYLGYPGALGARGPIGAYGNPLGPYRYHLGILGVPLASKGVPWALKGYPSAL